MSKIFKVEIERHKLNKEKLNILRSKPITKYLIEGLENYYDSTYVGKFEIGTPSVTMLLCVDTGSSDVWIPAGGSTYSDGKTVEKTFDTSESATYLDLADTFTLSYGSGDCTGYVGEDVVHMGKVSFPQKMGFATSISAYPFEHSSMNGILGATFKSISNLSTNTFFMNLFNHYKMKKTFSFYLNNTDSEHKSELFLGGINNDIIDGDPIYADITHDQYWMVDLNKVIMKGKIIQTNGSAILDTGTSLIWGPEEIVNKMVAMLGAKKIDQGLHVITAELKNLPELTFVMAKKKFKLRPEDYTITMDGITYFGITVLPHKNFWILGDSFLSNYYSVFDYSNNRVGLGKLKKCYKPN